MRDVRDREAAAGGSHVFYARAGLFLCLVGAVTTALLFTGCFNAEMAWKQISGGKDSSRSALQERRTTNRISRPGDSQGGLATSTSSTSYTLSKSSVGGSVQGVSTQSTNYKLKGGVYASP